MFDGLGIHKYRHCLEVRTQLFGVWCRILCDGKGLVTLLVSRKHLDQTTITCTLPCTCARSLKTVLSWTLTLFRSLERAICFRLSRLRGRYVRGSYDSIAWIMRRWWWVIAWTRSAEPLCYVWNRNQRNVRLPWFVSIERFTWRHGGHIGVPKLRNGGHVGVPNKSCGSWTLFLCKQFLLFS